MNLLTTLLAQATTTQPAAEEIDLEPTGALIMIVSVTLVLGLFGFCMYRILRDSSKE